MNVRFAGIYGLAAPIAAWNVRHVTVEMHVLGREFVRTNAGALKYVVGKVGMVNVQAVVPKVHENIDK